jgi:hypothetical protein
MGDRPDMLDEVGAITRHLGDLGLFPVLVGGMALVVLGSRRVTRDFDFVIAQPGPHLRAVVNMLYDHGLELAARVNADGDITATIRNRRVAAARLEIDSPTSAFFLNPGTTLRVDLLFDFPVAASTLASRARPMRIRSHLFHVASIQDLLELKRTATSARSAPSDTEDLAYLEQLARTVDGG